MIHVKSFLLDIELSINFFNKQNSIIVTKFNTKL